MVGWRGVSVGTFSSSSRENSLKYEAARLHFGFAAGVELLGTTNGVEWHDDVIRLAGSWNFTHVKQQHC